MQLEHSSPSRYAIAFSSRLIKTVAWVLAVGLPIYASASTQAAPIEPASFTVRAICESVCRLRSSFKNCNHQYRRTNPQKPLSQPCAKILCYQKSDVTRDSYLNLVIELKSGRSFKVIKASQIAGQLILRDYPVSDFVYEVTNDRMTLVIGFFPDDPFTVRGFADRDKAKETSAEGKTATVVINVPLTGAIAAAITKLHVRIIKLLSDPGSEVTSMVIKQLLEQKKALLLYDLTASKLGPAIRKNLVMLRD